MANFAPTGPSMMLQISGTQKQVIELPAMDGANIPAVRLLATISPSSTAYAFVAFGDASVDVSQFNGTPIDLTARKEAIIPLIGTPSNMAIVMSVGGAFTIYVTPGDLVA